MNVEDKKYGDIGGATNVDIEAYFRCRVLL